VVGSVVNLGWIGHPWPGKLNRAPPCPVPGHRPIIGQMAGIGSLYGALLDSIAWKENLPGPSLTCRSYRLRGMWEETAESGWSGVGPLHMHVPPFARLQGAGGLRNGTADDAAMGRNRPDAATPLKWSASTFSCSSLPTSPVTFPTPRF